MFCSRFLGLTVALLSVVTTPAATLVWNGGGADDNWSSALNWTGVSFTVGDTLQFGGSTRLAPVNDLAVDTLVGGLEFTNNTFASTSAFTLTGNRITLGGNITTTAVSGGTFNATINDQINLDLLLNATRTITVGNNADKTHNLTINGVISDGGGAFGLNMAGGARLTLANANTYTGTTTLGGTAIAVLNHATALPGGIGTSGGVSGLTFAGGMLGLGTGDFTRGLGTGVDQVQWTGNGGFAAFGADRVVNLGGSGATVTWAAGSFVPNNSVLFFGYGNGSDTQDSTHTLIFQNPIDLNGGTRTITVNDGNGNATTALIDATISGGIVNGTGTGALTKNGGGTLNLTAASTYTGQTHANAGVLLLNHVNALPGGVATSGGTSNLRISGNGVVGLGTGDFTRGLGTGVDQVQWTGAGGFAAFNADRVVNLGGAGATVTWATGSFVPNGSVFYLGANSATHTVDFQNPIDLGSAVRTIEINNAAAVALDAIISGPISGSGGLTKNGDGTLLLQSATSSYTGQTNLAVNVTRVTKLADFGQPSSIGAGTAGVPVTMSTQFRVGTLEYVGTGDSTNRTFAIGNTTATHTNGGVIQNNGSGPLTFTATNFNDAIAGITVGRTLTLGGTNTGLNTISGIIQNTNGLTAVLGVTKADAGTWVLAGANTYSGTTTVSGGALHLNNASAIGTGPLTLNSGGTIDNSSGTAITLSTANVTTISGNFTFGGTNDLSLANGTTNVTGTRTVTLSGTAGRTLTFGAMTINNAGGNTTLTVNDATSAGNKLVITSLVLADANQARSQTINGSAQVEITGAVQDGPGTGADAITYAGDGTLKLSGSNTYTGSTTLNNAAGTLTLAGSSTTSSVTLTAGRLNVNHAAALGTGTLTLTAGTLDNTSGSALTLTTNNPVTMGSAVTFGGSNNLNLGTGAVAFGTSDRVITLDGESTLTMGTGSFNSAATRTLQVNQGRGTDGRLVLSAFDLNVNADTAGRTRNLSGTGQLAITGPIVNGNAFNNGITKNGAGTLTLSGANTFGGSIIANAGTVILDYATNDPLPASGPITFNGVNIIVRGNTGTPTTDTTGALTMINSSRSTLRIENNAVITTSFGASGTVNPLLLDLTDGGTLTTAAALTTTSSSTNVALVNGVVMMGQRANLYVQDTSGIGFATQDGSNNLVRYTAANSLNGNTGGATTNTSHYSLSADLTRSATLSFSTLAIDTSSGPVTLNMGTFNLSPSGNGRSILVTGTNNATITSSTGVFTSGQSYNIANYGTGTTTMAVGSAGVAIVKNGPGLVDYTSTASPGDVYVTQGALRFSTAMNYNTNVLRIFGDGVFEIGADLNDTADGDFTRASGTAAGQVAIIGNGGFSAHGADRVVAIGGVAAPAALTWGGSNFLAANTTDNEYVFKLGSTTSTHTLEFRNAIALGTRHRVLDVANGTSTTNVDARLTGVLSGTGTLAKTGAGTLELTGANTYSGGTLLREGRLLISNDGTSSATGTGYVWTTENTVLGGSGTIAPTGTSEITIGGSVAPGTPGTNDGAGKLVFTPVTQNATFTATSTADFQLRTNGAHGLSVLFNPDGTLGSVSGASSDGGNDRLVFNGGSTTSKLDFTALAAGNFNITLVPGYTPQAGDVFDLLDWSNLNGAGHSSAIAGLSLSQLDLPSLAGFDPLLTWDTSFWTSQGVLAIYSGVPEPSRAMLLLIGAVFLQNRRVRRR